MCETVDSHLHTERTLFQPIYSVLQMLSQAFEVSHVLEPKCAYPSVALLEKDILKCSWSDFLPLQNALTNAPINYYNSAEWHLKLRCVAHSAKSKMGVKNSNKRSTISEVNLPQACAYPEGGVSMNTVILDCRAFFSESACSLT